MDNASISRVDASNIAIPGLEAMTYGAPVVASNATCIPEILGDAALYFDPNNTDDMAQTIGRVLDDPTLRKELIDRGHKQIKKYSWKRMAQQTHDVYTRAINSKG
jgi:glycosyltransferase involved in cell wall biosynthesis